MTYVWLSKDEFPRVLDFFLRTLALNHIEPIPRPTEEAVSYAAGRIASIDEPVFGRRRHRSLTKKLAVAVYELCKGHIFINGNKRIAYFFLIYLLLMNGLRLRAGLHRRADFLKWIAASDPGRREQVIRSIVRFLRSEIEPIPPGELRRLGFSVNRP